MQVVVAAVVVSGEEELLHLVVVVDSCLEDTTSVIAIDHLGAAVAAAVDLQADLLVVIVEDGHGHDLLHTIHVVREGLAVLKEWEVEVKVDAVDTVHRHQQRQEAEALPEDVALTEEVVVL